LSGRFLRETDAARFRARGSVDCGARLQAKTRAVAIRVAKAVDPRRHKPRMTTKAARA
jgi:hypothetical protein